MKKTKTRLILCITLLIAVLTFIWGNSAMPGKESGALSGWVGEFLSKILPFLSLESEIGMYILRKLAHFSEFAALGMILSWLFGMLTQRPVRQRLFPLLCGVGAACIDETIQIYVPDRGSSLTDVWLDTAGFVTGLSLCVLVRHLTQHFKEKSK
jgi:VanZ family protein